MIGQVTVVAVAAAGGGREAGQARLGATVLKNSGLVGQHRTHISSQCLHIRCEEDSVLLGLIPEYIKALSKGEHRVL